MTFDIMKIMDMLPHRYPFLLLDKILEIGPDQVVGLKNVTINEPFFQGHFPGHPIMPGVLIIEAMAQAGGLLAYSLLPDNQGKAVYFMGMDKVKFRRPVRPGDQLVFKIKLLRQRGAVFKMRGEAFVEDQLVAEGELMATTDPGKSDSEN
ncbi:MAG: 3-hydroxyacyl-ACP dehydratase FabZ [Syntrophobacteraceae bacterium]